MDNMFQLDNYLSDGVDNIVKGAIKASFKNPKESLFIARFALASKDAKGIRNRYAKEGTHIPPFLICSITDSCNLNCKGCYARINHTRNSHRKEELMDLKDWKRIFGEASEVGVSFILLAGGEPFLRQEVIEAAADYKKIIFAVFTNGTLFNEQNLLLFDKNRNLLPILSIEGNVEFTDNRRGTGIYSTAQLAMQKLYDRGIFFGVSITATKKNLSDITSDSFLSDLYRKGCKIVFYVEYVPVSAGSEKLAFTDNEREVLDRSLNVLRQKFADMIILSFPGDERSTGGCLAAGRGFFHINPYGSAEPCPFSPYSDTNVKNHTLLDTLNSPLFKRLAASEILATEHMGGCVLFEQEAAVKELCQGMEL